jgi:hypothetical protein
MLRTPPHPTISEPTADRTERLLASIRVPLITTRTALCAAGRALRVRWQRPGLPTRRSARAREATP